MPAVPDNFERLRSDYMVELHLKVMQHQLDQVSQHACSLVEQHCEVFL